MEPPTIPDLVSLLRESLPVQLPSFPDVDPPINQPLFIHRGVFPSKSDDSPLNPRTPPY